MYIFGGLSLAIAFELAFIPIIISILNIVSYFILNKAFMDVEARKNSYLEVFFEIKGNLIISSLTKCEAFVKRLQNTDGDDIYYQGKSAQFPTQFSAYNPRQFGL